MHNALFFVKCGSFKRNKNISIVRLQICYKIASVPFSAKEGRSSTSGRLQTVIKIALDGGSIILTLDDIQSTMIFAYVVATKQNISFSDFTRLRASVT